VVAVRLGKEEAAAEGLVAEAADVLLRQDAEVTSFELNSFKLDEERRQPTSGRRRGRGRRTVSRRVFGAPREYTGLR